VIIVQLQESNFPLSWWEQDTFNEMILIATLY